jgi:hypothetical protein
VLFLGCLPVAALGIVGALLLKEVQLRGGYVAAEEGVVLSEGAALGESLGMMPPEDPAARKKRAATSSRGSRAGAR